MAVALSINSPKPISSDSFPNEKKREKTENLFKKFGWQPLLPLFETHPDFCHFLVKSKLAYAIRGYQHTIETGGDTPQGMEALKEGIRIDADGSPCLLKEGKWVRWETIKNEFDYDKKQQELHSKTDRKEIWNYLYDPSTGEQGLVKGSRFGVVRPIYQLSETQIEKLGIKNRSAIQLFSSDNQIIPKISHCGMRLINEKGWVYSLAFETAQDEPFFEAGQKVVGTYDATITSNDYDEHRFFTSRRVTTIPISEEKFNVALERVREYAKMPLRFNRVHQSCLAYTADIAKTAGVEIPDLVCHTYEFVGRGLTELSPVFRIIGKVVSFVRGILNWCAKIPVLGLPFKAVLWIAHKVGVVAGNLLVVSLGGKHCSCPRSEIDNRDNKEKLTYFHKLVRNWKDYFDEETGKLHSTFRFADWQLAHPGTTVHKYSGSPKYCF